MTKIVAAGLDGVIAAETRLSHVDGAAGELIIAGKPVARLVAEDGYEGAAALLWQGLAAPASSRDAIVDALGGARVAAFAALGWAWPHLARLEPAEAVRAAAALVPDDTPDAHLALTATLAVTLPAVLRVRSGREPIAPDPAATTAADILRMLGGAAGPGPAAGLDAYLTTVCDHGLNASTFAARVIASTQSGLASAVTGAIGALKGPLHGGAPGPVLDMLDAVAASGDASAWLDSELAAGRRLMGFGHRIYRVRDPRADVLKGAVARLGAGAGRIAAAEAVEAQALAALARRHPDRRLDTNVEFFTALLLDALGFPRDAFTAVFAVGRVLGWTAHALEQKACGRLIRPQSRYVGPAIDRAA